MRVWGKICKNNHLLRDVVVETFDDTRTHCIFHALSEICMQLDLAVPAWLDSNVKEFGRRAKTRFRQDSFIEEIDFDYLEIEILEE